MKALRKARAVDGAELADVLVPQPSPTCAAQRHDACERCTGLGLTRDGAFAPWVRVPARNCGPDWPAALALMGELSVVMAPMVSHVAPRLLRCTHACALAKDPSEPASPPAVKRVAQAAPVFRVQRPLRAHALAAWAACRHHTRFDGAVLHSVLPGGERSRHTP